MNQQWKQKRLRTPALKVFKTLNNMNLEYMKEIFHKTSFLTLGSLYLEVNENHTTKYGNESIRCLGPDIWNSLPNQIKKETDYVKFKEFIKDWLGMKCKCNIFFDVSTEMSILYCQYDLGFDPLLVGNGFHYFFVFLFNFMLFVCYL